MVVQHPPISISGLASDLSHPIACRIDSTHGRADSRHVERSENSPRRRSCRVSTVPGVNLPANDLSLECVTFGGLHGGTAVPLHARVVCTQCSMRKHARHAGGSGIFLLSDSCPDKETILPCREPERVLRSFSRMYLGVHYCMRAEMSLSSTHFAAPAKEVPGITQAVSMYFLIQTLTPGHIDMDLRQSGKPEMNPRLSISGPVSHAQATYERTPRCP